MRGIDSIVNDKKVPEFALVPGSTNSEQIIGSEIKLLLLILMLNEELYSLLIIGS